MAFDRHSLIAAAVALAAAGAAHSAGSGDHTHDHGTPEEMLETMRDAHAGHDHGHDFEAMEGISEETMHRTMDFLMDIGLVLPTMDSRRGAEAFMNRGCIVCHRINGVGGEIGPSFNAADMPQPMNAFEFAARMWRGADSMVQMQEELFGAMIELDGQELADIVAFVHDEDVQASISEEAIPEQYRSLIP